MRKSEIAKMVPAKCKKLSMRKIETPANFFFSSEDANLLTRSYV